MAKNRSIPWWEIETGDDEIKRVTAVLKSQYLNEGDFTAEFEHEVARLVGAKHAVATTSGTAAIFMALAACGIGPGDEVIVPDMTFIATANAVKLAGAVPVLVDVEPYNLNLDLKRADQALTARTKAIVPVHVSGRAADMSSIVRWAAEKGLLVVEDAAEALLSRHQNRFLGTFGKAGCFSFSANKTVTTGQGGMVVTDDEQVAVSLRELKDQGRSVRGTGGDDLHNRVGYNFKLTNLQAAVGLAQLSRLTIRAKRLRRNYEIYRERLTGSDGISLVGFDIEKGELPLWTDAIAPDRDRLVKHLKDQGMQCRNFWFPLHRQAPYRQADKNFANSTRLAYQAFWLPSSFLLTDQDIHRVCDMIRAFSEKQIAA